MKYILLFLVVVAALIAGCGTAVPSDFADAHTRNVSTTTQYGHIAVAYIPTGDERSVSFSTRACCHSRTTITYDPVLEMPKTNIEYDSYNVGEQTFNMFGGPIGYASGEPDSGGHTEYVTMKVTGTFNETFDYNINYQFDTNGKVYGNGALIEVKRNV